MPDHGLEGFGVRRDVVGIDGRDDHAGVGLRGCVTAVFTYDADHARADLLGELDGGDETGGDVFLEVAAADGEDEERVFGVEAGAAEPLDEHAGPTVVVGAGGEFRDVVGRRVNFEAGDFTEIVDGMGGVGRAAADAEDEQTATAIADADEFLRALFDGDGIKFGDDFSGL